MSPPRVMAEEPMAPALPSPPASGELSCKASVFLPRSDWCTACTPRLNRRGGLKCRGCKPRWILDGSSTELTATLAAKKTAEDAGVGAGSRKRKAAVRAKQKVGEALEDNAKSEGVHDDANEAWSRRKRSKVSVACLGCALCIATSSVALNILSCPRSISSAVARVSADPEEETRPPCRY